MYQSSWDVYIRHVGYYSAHHPPCVLSVEADIFWSLINCLTLAVTLTHNDNDIWGNGKGCESQTRRVCSTLYIIYVGQPARRPCTLMQPVDHTQISLASSMKMQWKKSWALSLKKKESAKTCEVSPIAVFWLIWVTDNRFYVGWSMIISTKHIGFIKRSPFVWISKKFGAACKKVPPR